MTDPAHSLRNTILLILDHLDLDPARIISRMGQKRRFGRISVRNRTCYSVYRISEAGAKSLGIGLPAFALNVSDRQLKKLYGPILVVHVRTYRDGAGNPVRYAEVDTVEELLKAQRPFTGRMRVPPSDGMVMRCGPPHGDPGSIGSHPADI